MNIEISDDAAPCLSVRHKVFIEEQGFPLDIDEFDDTAVHLLAKSGEQDIGAARVVFSGTTAKIGRVCVLPEARGTGLGAALINAAIDVARARPDISEARLRSQVRAMGFYARLGFTADGPQSDDFGVPHCDMVRAL